MTTNRIKKFSMFNLFVTSKMAFSNLTERSHSAALGGYVAGHSESTRAVLSIA
jgi:hypothetical protein